MRQHERGHQQYIYPSLPNSPPKDSDKLLVASTAPFSFRLRRTVLFGWYPASSSAPHTNSSRSPSQAYCPLTLATAALQGVSNETVQHITPSAFGILHTSTPRYSSDSTSQSSFSINLHRMHHGLYRLVGDSHQITHIAQYHLIVLALIWIATWRLQTSGLAFVG